MPSRYASACASPNVSNPYMNICKRSSSASCVSRYSLMQYPARPGDFLRLGKDFVDGAAADAAVSGSGQLAPQLLHGQFLFAPGAIAADQIADIVAGSGVIAVPDLGLDPVFHGIGQGYGHGRHGWCLLFLSGYQK